MPNTMQDLGNMGIKLTSRRYGLYLLEVTGKGEKEKYTHLNVEFRRIARRDKKIFLSKQLKKKKSGGNNRKRKTRDFFKKIRDTKGTFHAKIGTLKDRYSMNLTESEDI